MPRDPISIFHPDQDFPIMVEQLSANRYRVTYGAQTKICDGWEAASREVGACLFHSLECSALIERKG